MKFLALFLTFLLFIGSFVADCQFLSNKEKQAGSPAVYAGHGEHVGNWNPVRRRKRQFLSQQQPPSKSPANYAPHNEGVGNWNPK